ncbi:Dynein light chain [Quillaja saponaria]|uniref:Dynein light chain n=1 Tax=Quillaja saponaria TaxID=32244 RepID=A0AAD7L0M2_QUISA|nr:Dynein light chain [Quillaja saponaria]
MEGKQSSNIFSPGMQNLSKPTHEISSSSSSSLSLSIKEVKLAAIAISLNVRLKSSDMPVHVQEHALRYTRSLVGDSLPIKSSTHHLNPTHLARSLKKEFDSVYGPAWHCVVGKSFGSFVTHTPGGFVYFSIDSLSVLLFKTEVQLVTEPS